MLSPSEVLWQFQTSIEIQWLKNFFAVVDQPPKLSFASSSRYSSQVDAVTSRGPFVVVLVIIFPSSFEIDCSGAESTISGRCRCCELHSGGLPPLFSRCAGFPLTPASANDALIPSILSVANMNLSSDVVNGSQLLTDTTPATTEYLAPSPPLGASHRYLFVMYPQSSAVKGSAPFAPLTHDGSRPNFNLQAFTYAFQLGTPIAATFFTVNRTGGFGVDPVANAQHGVPSSSTPSTSHGIFGEKSKIMTWAVISQMLAFFLCLV